MSTLLSYYSLVWLVMLVWCGVGDRGATGPAERHHVLRVACDAGVVWCR